MADFTSISHENRIDFLARLAKVQADERDAARLLRKANRAAGDGCANFRLNQRLFDRANGHG